MDTYPSGRGEVVIIIQRGGGARAGRGGGGAGGGDEEAVLVDLALRVRLAHHLPACQREGAAGGRGEWVRETYT